MPDLFQAGRGVQAAMVGMQKMGGIDAQISSDRRRSQEDAQPGVRPVDLPWLSPLGPSEARFEGLESKFLIQPALSCKLLVLREAAARLPEFAGQSTLVLLSVYKHLKRLR
jgi:hypothetical protein